MKGTEGNPPTLPIRGVVNVGQRRARLPFAEAPDVPGGAPCELETASSSARSALFVRHPHGIAAVVPCFSIGFGCWPGPPAPANARLKCQSTSWSMTQVGPTTFASAARTSQPSSRSEVTMAALRFASANAATVSSPSSGACTTFTPSKSSTDRQLQPRRAIR